MTTSRTTSPTPSTSYWACSICGGHLTSHTAPCQGPTHPDLARTPEGKVIPRLPFRTDTILPTLPASTEGD